MFLSKTIAAKARAMFTDLKTDSSNELIDAMSAIYLLDNSDTKQLFGEFIAERIPAIKSTLDIENTDKSLIFLSNSIYDPFDSFYLNKIKIPASRNELLIAWKRLPAPWTTSTTYFLTILVNFELQVFYLYLF